MTADGSISPLTEEVKKEYMDKLHELSSEVTSTPLALLLTTPFR